MENEEVAKLLDDWMTKIEQSGNEYAKMASGKDNLILKMKLRDMLNFLRMPEKAEELNAQLALIKK